VIAAVATTSDAEEWMA